MPIENISQDDCTVGLGRIRESSKYYGQTKHGAWFPVVFQGETNHSIYGNANYYSLCDLDLGVEVPKFKGEDGETIVLQIR